MVLVAVVVSGGGGGNHTTMMSTTATATATAAAASVAAAAVVERNVYEKASMSIAVSGETDAEADTFLKDKLCEQGLKGARHDPKSPRLGGHPI